MKKIAVIFGELPFRGNGVYNQETPPLFAFFAAKRNKNGVAQLRVLGSANRE